MAQLFNACEHLLDRRLAAGDGQRPATCGVAGELSHGHLHDRGCRAAAGDTLEPGGGWVPPAEVEARLPAHEAAA